MSMVIGMFSNMITISAWQASILISSTLISTPITLFAFWELYTFLQTQHLCDNAIEAAKKLIKSLESFCQILDKSILLIREFEVIGKGITVYHPNLPLLKLGTQKRGMCCVLRNCMLRNMLTSFRTFKKMAVNLMKVLPVDLRIIYKEDSISNISDLEIESSLGIDCSMDEHNISTDALKSLICLNKTQIIEILQHIALTICRLLDETEAENQNPPIKSLLQLIGKDFIEQQPILENITKDLLCKCVFTKQHEFRAKLVTKESRPISSQRDRFSDLMMIIDSASLHLKSSLDRLQCIEDILPWSQSTSPDSQCMGLTVGYFF